MRSSERINRPNPVKSKASKFAAGLLLASTATLGSCADSEPIPKQKTTTTTQQEVTTTTLSPEEQKLNEQIEESAVNNALRIVEILEGPRSGVEQFSGNRFSNELSVPGPDNVIYTGDDSQLPNTNVELVTSNGEVVMRFGLSKGIIVGQEEGYLDSVNIEIGVSPKSEIATKDTALCLEDFRSALVSDEGLVIEQYDSSAYYVLPGGETHENVAVVTGRLYGEYDDGYDRIVEHGAQALRSAELYTQRIINGSQG
ncbi:hypothetical protein KA068_00545 [Candidatus Saccharibacteria bacterium]|nr:hypothetical protein [Candidatus Saccharibacteria bacterium]